MGWSQVAGNSCGQVGEQWSVAYWPLEHLFSRPLHGCLFLWPRGAIFGSSHKDCGGTVAGAPASLDLGLL